MTALLLALIPPLFYSISNFVDKILIEKYSLPPLQIAYVFNFLLGVYGLIPVAIFGMAEIDLRLIAVMVLFGFLMGMYVIPYFIALGIDETSRVIPLFQFSPVIFLLLCLPIFHESFSYWQMLGAAIIILGGLALSIDKNSKGLFRLRPAFYLILVASAMYASAGILLKSVVIDYPISTMLFFFGIGQILSAFGVKWWAKIQEATFVPLHASLPILLLFAIGSMLGFSAVPIEAYAMTIAPASFVRTVSAIQPLYVVVIGYLLTIFAPTFLKEDIRAKVLVFKIAICILMMFGVYLLQNYQVNPPKIPPV